MTHPREWHEARRSGLGASDIAAVIGLSPWKTPRQVWAEKVTPLPPDYVEPTPKLKLWLGLRMEEVIAELYEAETGVKLRRPAEPYRHPTAPLFASLDFIRLNVPGHVEAKVANFGEEWGVPPDGEVPRQYYPQVQAQLACRPAEEAEVAVLWHGQEFRRYTVRADRQYIDDIVEFATSWWEQYVVGGVEPPPVAGDDADIRRRFPRDDGTEMVATPEMTLLVENLRVARLTAIDATLQQQGLEAAVKESMGEAAKLIGPGFSISYRKSKDREAVNWEAIAAAYRTIIEDGIPAPHTQADVSELLDTLVGLHSSEVTGPRVFRPTWKGERG